MVIDPIEFLLSHGNYCAADPFDLITMRLLSAEVLMSSLISWFYCII
jgi:hypothetical protein